MRALGAALTVSLAGLLAGVGGGSALAQTTVTGDSLAYPYQEWANWWEFNRMPSPQQTIEVEEIGEGEGCSACTWLREPAVVRMTVPRPAPRQAWLHELGHWFDYAELAPIQRGRFINLLDTGMLRGEAETLDVLDPLWLDREQGHFSPHEVFADAYKACAGSRMRKIRPNRPRRRVIRWSFLAPPGFGETQVVRTCGMILRAAGR